MQGYATILMQEFGVNLDQECRAYLERITSSANRMDQLIQDVLSLSRVSHSEFNLHSVNLDHLLRGILETYPNLQPPQVNIEIEGHLPFVMGNAAGLTQCFSNLLGNAVKFVAPDIHPRVRIWAEKVNLLTGDDTARRIRIFVQDNGIGIQKDAQEKIFAIFQRMNRGYDGTGIGLAIVKKAIERMGGRVGLHSEPGKGSTFWLGLNEGEKNP